VLQSPIDASDRNHVQDGILPIDMSETEVNDLFASCLPTLRKLAGRMLRNPQDAEDALQDGLLLAFRKLHQFQGRSAFSTWLHSVVRNSARMHYRKAKANQSSLGEPVGEEEGFLFLERAFVETRPTPEQLCIEQERSDILRRATEELPAKYHEAIKYFHLEGLGEKETARRLRMTPSALKAQLHRSRRLLTSRIRGSYVPESPKIWAFFREVPHPGSAGRRGKCRAGRSSVPRTVQGMML
jgi:RNA polymerase sigma-70 factor, ECF subfamily